MTSPITWKTPEDIQKENNYNDNPFGLVYKDAITENKPGAVQIHPISYSLGNLRIAANVYSPVSYDEGRNKLWPAVVVAHPNGGVKEQVAGLFAQKLAENGFIAMAMDASYQGRSEGLPRNTDMPAHRVEDIHRAADILSLYPNADPQRLGILGICGGGGYTIKAAQTDRRFKAVATLSLFNSGVVRRDGFRGSQTATIQKRLEEASKARQQEAAGGEVLYTPDMKEMSKEDASKLPYDLYREGYEYYALTHAHPESSFRYTVSSLLDLMRFDAAENAQLISQPLLMMAGSVADTFYMTEAVFAAATGTPEKELFLIDGATHIQTYWKEPFVTIEVEKLAAFFNQWL